MGVGFNPIREPREGAWASLQRHVDDWLKAMADEHDQVALWLLISGLLLSVAAFLLPDILSVRFDGALKDGASIVPPEGYARIVSKEVGFMFAPNWMLTGIVLLPYAVMQALKARSEIEGVFRTLIERRMLVTSAFGRPDVDMVLDAWRRRSRRMMPFLLLVLVVVFGMVIYDYLTVVLQWTTASGDALAALIRDVPPPQKVVTLHHADYEFYWSVAAIFRNSTIGATWNALFAAAAYLLIAGFGSAFLFGIFIYFIAFGGFFNRRAMERNGLRLIPDPKSDDEKGRCGFEAFEDFFDPFIQAAVATALIALAMYLQNMYLRAPEQANIVNMVFGPLTDFIRELFSGKLDFAKLVDKGLVDNIAQLTGFRFVSGIPMQIFGSAIGLLVLVVVVFAYVWSMLRGSAISGRAALRAQATAQPGAAVSGTVYTGEDIAKLAKIPVWPLGWISMNLLLSCIIVVIAALYYPRLVTLIVAVLIVRSVKSVLGRLHGGI